MDLAPYIREIILLNECVILPEFGGFETQYEPAQYDGMHKRVLPPTKKVHFRADFIKGGGVLEDHLCTHLKIEKSESVELIEKYVKELKETLEKDREVIIEGVGLFTYELGNALTFTAFDDQNYLIDSFGLDPLPFEKVKHTTPPLKKKELKIRPRSNTLMFVIIGIGLIGVLLAITIFISAKFNIYIFNFGEAEGQHDMIIIGNNYNSDSTYQKIDETLSTSTDLKTALYYSEDKPDNTIRKQTYYYLVAGSFKSRKNAELTSKELLTEGYNVEIIENQGYYRVTVGTFADKPESLRELQRLRRQINRSIWLLTVEKSN